MSNLVKSAIFTEILESPVQRKLVRLKMRIQYSHLIIFSVILILFLFGHVGDCFSAGLEFEFMLDQEVTQLEETWKTESAFEYYAQADGIMKAIIADSARVNLNTVASRLFKNLLSKELKAKDVGITDILVMKKLTLFLISTGDAISLDERQNNTGLLSDFLGRIRNEMVIDYKPKIVFANVSPPTGVLGMAGMSPDAIKDPIAKANYEAAIKHNRENNASNARQRALVESDKEVSRPIIAYMIETFRAGHAPSDLLNRWISAAMLSEHEKANVLSGNTKK
jgi:hypothetical protein